MAETPPDNDVTERARARRSAASHVDIIGEHDDWSSDSDDGDDVTNLIDDANVMLDTGFRWEVDAQSVAPSDYLLHVDEYFTHGSSRRQMPGVSRMQRTIESLEARAKQEMLAQARARDRDQQRRAAANAAAGREYASAMRSAAPVLTTIGPQQTAPPPTSARARRQAPRPADASASASDAGPSSAPRAARRKKPDAHEANAPPTPGAPTAAARPASAPHSARELVVNVATDGRSTVAVPPAPRAPRKRQPVEAWGAQDPPDGASSRARVAPRRAKTVVVVPGGASTS